MKCAPCPSILVGDDVRRKVKGIELWVSAWTWIRISRSNPKVPRKRYWHERITTTAVAETVAPASAAAPAAAVAGTAAATVVVVVVVAVGIVEMLRRKGQGGALRPLPWS